jgi:hypothetical protein
VSNNGLLRKIFGPQRDEVTEEWRILHKKELNGLYFLPNIISMKWSGSVARMGIREVHTGFWWGNLRERDHLENVGIILMWILRKWNKGAWTGLIWLRTGRDGRLL